MKKKILSIFFIFLAFCAFSKSKKKAVSLDEAIEEAANKFIEKADVGSKVFLGNFDALNADGTKSSELENYIMNSLQTLLVDSSSLDVSERAQLESIQAEINYQQAGNVKDEEWVELGRQDGAQYAIYGSGKWKSSTYEIILKMTHIETAKIAFNYRGEVDGRDKELRQMLSKVAQTEPKKSKLAGKFTLALTGGFHGETGEHASWAEDNIFAVYQTENSNYSVKENQYDSLTGAFSINFKLGHGFGLESGVGFWNGGEEIIVSRNSTGDNFRAEKYKCSAVDVPLCASFQFKLFRTSIKLLGGMNFSLPLRATYVYRGLGAGDKVDFSPEKKIIPGLVLGFDYMIPVFRKIGLDFALRYEKDFLPYEINYESEVRELFTRSSVNIMAGLYCML